jgi:protein-S-isoprenylcysteine O-methyltransferase Ste14
MQEKKSEHPFGDAGQLILLGVFFVVWIVDSFFLRASTFLSDYMALPVRLSISATAFIAAVCLFKSGHVAVSHEQRPHSVISTGAFRYLRPPIGSLARGACRDIRLLQLHRRLRGEGDGGEVWRGIYEI